MSTDPEDALLEEALRADLPSLDTEARLRRRLLASGLAIGNGIATTTAAASGGTGASTGGLLAKVAGLSWGVKVGLAAAVAIPSVGLLLDPREPTRTTSQPSVVAAAQPAAATPTVERLDAPSLTQPALEVERTAPPERATRSARPLVEASAPTANAVQTDPARPSRRDFAASEPPAGMLQTPSTLAEETRILDGAFAALSAGNRARAATLIAEHEARYPQGLLNEERLRAKTRLSELSRGN